MDTEKVNLVRLLIGDIPTSPFYPLFTDEQILSLLEMNGGKVILAARYAAISASFLLASTSTRERTGEIEVWNDLASNYRKALEDLLTNTDKDIPNGLMPWAGGISRRQICEYARNPDIPRNKLLNVSICDCEDACGKWKLIFGGC